MGGSEEASCRLDLKHLEIDWWFMTLCIGGLILVSMSLEFFIYQLEFRLRDHDHYLRMLRRVYKEIVILGALAFVMMMIRDFGHLTHEQFEYVEFAHIWIFLVGFVFVLQAILIMLLTSRVKDRWDAALIGDARRILNEYDERMAQGTLRFRHRWVRYLLGKDRVLEKLELLIFKEQFISAVKLPKSFDFAKFLRRYLSLHIVEDFDIGWRSWLLLVFLCLVAFLILQFANISSTFVEPISILWINMALSLLNVLLAIVILLVVERCRDKLLHLTGCESIRSVANHVRHIIVPKTNEFEHVALLRQESEESDISRTMSRSSAISARMKREGLESYETRDHIHHRHRKRIIDVDDLLIDAYTTKAQYLEVFPFHRPFALLFGFEFVLLLQSFTVGLMVLLSASLYSTAPWTIAVVIVTIIINIAMQLFVTPRIVRNWGLLEALCLIDRSSLDVVDYVLKSQEEIHLITRRFAITIYDAFLETLELVVKETQMKAQLAAEQADNQFSFQLQSTASVQTPVPQEPARNKVVAVDVDPSMDTSMDCAKSIVIASSNEDESSSSSSSGGSKASGSPPRGGSHNQAHSELAQQHNESIQHLNGSAHQLKGPTHQRNEPTHQRNEPAHHHNASTPPQQPIDDPSEPPRSATITDAHTKTSAQAVDHLALDVETAPSSDRRRNSAPFQLRGPPGKSSPPPTPEMLPIHRSSSIGRTTSRNAPRYQGLPAIPSSTEMEKDLGLPPKFPRVESLSGMSSRNRHSGASLGNRPSERRKSLKGMTPVQRLQTFERMDSTSSTKSDRERQQKVSRTVRSLSVDQDLAIPLEDYVKLVARFLKTNNDTRVAQLAFLGDNYDAEDVLNQTFAQLFQLLDKEKRGVVSPQTLKRQIAQHPFRFHLSDKQCRRLLRTLGCKNGFTLYEFIHIVHVAFRYLSVEDNGDDSGKVDDCFGSNTTVKCTLCETEIPVTLLKAHAGKCSKAQPNYALDIVTKAVRRIKDNNAKDDMHLLDPLPWTTRPRRMSFSTYMENLEVMSDDPHTDLPNSGVEGTI